MQTIVEIHGDPWKLEDISDQVAWCKDQSWTLATYQKSDDHDHCRICWWAIGESDDPEVGIAYCVGNNNWLCQECYRKFIQ